MTSHHPLAVLTAALALFLGAAAAAQTPPTAGPAATPTATPPTAVVAEEGLVAEFYAADPSRTVSGAVIVLGGSEGGLGGSRGLARRLAAEGIPAMAVSYFGEPGQSPRLDLIPIEPVARAQAWLRSRPEVGDAPIALLGVSKGAELALLVASSNRDIRAVVVGAPTSVVWQGIDQTGASTGSSWTADGAPIPYVPYDMSQGFNGVYRLYADSLEGALPETQIPVERIAGPILMISGAEDGLWPAADMAGRIERRLAERGFDHEVVSLVYPGAGHAGFGPPIATVTPGLQQAVGFLGGSVEGTMAARADGWPRVVAFLRDALSGE